MQQAPQEINAAETSSASPYKRSGLRGWAIAMVVIALCGFLDATYLTVKHYLGTPLPCSLLHGCEVVTTSVYSVVGGVPIALLGALYYLLILVLTIVYLDKKNRYVLKTVAYVTVLGFLASLVLVYLQLFVLHAICEYCMFSATTSTCLFIAGMIALKKLRKLSAISQIA